MSIQRLSVVLVRLVAHGRRTSDRVPGTGGVARVLLAAGLLVQPWMLAQAQDWAEFKDWIVACDEAKRCMATGISPPGSVGAWASLGFERSGTGGDLIERVRVAVHADVQSGAQTLLQADGQRLGELVARKDIDGEPVLFESVDSATVTAVLTAMRRSSQIELAFAGTRYRISLAGASATLLWIDAQQRSSGTESALVPEGGKPEERVSGRVAPVPVRAAVDPGAVELDGPAATALAAKVRAVVSPVPVCEEPDPDQTIRADRAWQLDPEHRMLVISCDAPGAYNWERYWFLLDSHGRAKAIPLDTAGSTGNALFNGAFDPATATLKGFFKGRGMGDCGQLNEWVWDGRGFVHTSFRVMSHCSLVPKSLWPRVIDRPVLGRKQ